MNIIRSIITAVALAAALPTFAQNQAVLTWTAPATYTDGTPITAILSYHVYQGLQGQPLAIVPALTTTSTTVTVNSGLLGGATYCWAVSAFIGTNESAKSTAACKTFAPSIIPSPTLTVQ